MSAEILGPLGETEAAGVLLLFDRVSCGFPSPAADYAETALSLDQLVGLRQPSMFLARVKGDSMINAGIYPEDILIVDKALEALSGNVVMAMVGGEFTVKTLSIVAGQVMLVPANDQYRPIVIQPDEELLVWGVCTWNLHRLTRC